MSIFEEFELRGEARGITQEKHNTIIRSWKNGIDIPMISNITSLSVSEINKVIAEYQPKTMSIFEEFEFKGFARGIIQGISQEKHNTIICSWKNGIDIAMISNITGVDVSEVRKGITEHQART